MALLLGHWNLISFSAMTVAIMNWHTLPELLWLIPLSAMILVCWVCRPLKSALGIVLAVALSLVHNHDYVSQTNTLFECGENITIDIHLNSTFKSNLYFSFSIVSAEGITECHQPFKGKLFVRIPIDLPHKFKLGETWRVKAEIKPIVGLLNQAGFDAERYYFGQQVMAKAQVTEIIGQVASQDLRGRWYDSVFEHVENLDSKSLILALMFGDRSSIETPLWQGLKQTGLVHLIAISGLHIGLAFAVGWWMGALVRVGMPRLIWMPLVVALLMATFYAWLAGFSLPTQRALVMCWAYAFFLYLGMKVSHWRVLWFTLALILAVEPSSVMTVSLWLSVLAVACILLAIDYAPMPLSTQLGRLKLWGRIQLFLALGLAPISAFALGGIAPFAFIYNAFFVPLVSLFVVPALLLALLTSFIMEPITQIALNFADFWLSILLWSVQWSDRFEGLWLPLTRWQMLLCIGFFSLIIFRRFKWWLIFISMPIWLTVSFLSKPAMDWKLEVLDVGHGLAVAITHSERTLLYDTGASWGEGSMADAVITPVLNVTGYPLDALFISHWDNDHQGGMTTIIDTFQPKEVLSPQLDHQDNPCVKGRLWWWQGLNFQILWPPKRVIRAYNPHSCVIRVTDGTHSVLLTGDINALVEYQLINDTHLNAEVLIVPHHGSSTSSTKAFVKKVEPKLAIASLAKQGRWALPNKQVVNTYTEQGVRWMDTGTYGQISVHFSRDNFKVLTQRNRQTDAWYRQILRNRVE
jgi:competence protein ComEC